MPCEVTFEKKTNKQELSSSDPAGGDDKFQARKKCLSEMQGNYYNYYDSLFF